MTHKKNLKQCVRQRMSKTGERYTRARQHVLQKIAAEDAYDAAHERSLQGNAFTPAEAAAVEAHLHTHPNDLAARAQLLGYYFGRSEDVDRAARRGHVHWVIEHAPTDPVAGLAFATLHQDSGYEAGKERWLDQVRARGEEPAVLLQAASYLQQRDGALAQALLRRALRTADEDAADLRRELGLQLTLDGDPRGALEQFEAAFEGAEGAERLHQLEDLARAAMRAEEFERAQAYATELLALAPQFEGDWAHGNAVHWGHVVLGHLALQRGALEEAAAELVRAGRTPGSPQLDSFGPDLTLARELAAREERACVLDYLEGVGRFWEFGRERLEGWTAELRAGRVPDLAR